MNQNKSKTFIFSGFIITAITLLTFYLLTYSSLKTTVSQSREEQIVLKMMRHLDDLQLNESDIESTERPSILSAEKNKAVVQKFRESAIKFTNELTELRKLSDSDHLPRKEILQLVTLGEKKLSFSEEIFGLSTNGDPKVASSELIAREDRFDPPFREQYNKVSDFGRDQLRSFQEEHDANAKSTFQLFGLLGMIALMIMGYLYYRIWQRSKLINTISEELITVNDRLEERVKKQTSLISEMYERISDGFAAFDKDLNITYVNKFFENLLNTPSSEIIGKNVMKDFANFAGVDILQNAVSSQQDIRTDIFNEKYNKWFNISFYPSSNGVSVFLKDINERKQFQLQLEQSQGELNSLFENAKDVIGIVDSEGKIIKVNSVVEDMFGYTKEETLSMNVNDFLFPKDLSKKPFEFEKVPQEGFLLTVGKYKKKDGTALYAEMKSSLLPDGTYMGIIRDITERKLQQNEINKLIDILDNSSALIGTMDMNFRVTYMNKATRTAIEIDDDADLSELSLFTFFDNKTAPIDETIAEVMSRGFWKGENVLLTKSGKEIPIMKAVYLHRNEKGDPSFISSNAIDITELKTKERELEKLANIIEYSQAYILVVDVNMNLLYVNKAAKEKLGIREDEDITKLSGLDFIPDETKAKMKAEEPKLIAEGKWLGEANFLNRKGEIIPVYEVAIVHNDKSGVMQYISLTLVDISELKQKENELRNLTSILENSPAYITMANIDKQFVYVNPAFRNAFGIPEDEDITNLNVSQFRTPETKEIIKNGDDSNLNNGKWVGTNSFVSRSGKDIPVMEVIVVHKDKKGEPERISFTAIDLTEQKKVEKELMRVNNELRELSIHLQNLIERERTAIAKEIHDQFSQNLAALGMNAAWLRSNVKNENSKVQEIIKEQIAIAEEAIESSRNLYNSLHPTMLDEIGLEATIKWHTKTLLRYSDIKTEIQSNVEDEKFTKEINLGLFRIFQESLANVLRYSKATHLTITIHKNEEIITMTIEDNGIGFDINKVDASQSHGLLGIRERVYAMSGRSSIESTHGKGTKVEVQIPLFVVEEKTMSTGNN